MHSRPLLTQNVLVLKHVQGRLRVATPGPAPGLTSLPPDLGLQTPSFWPLSRGNEGAGIFMVNLTQIKLPLCMESHYLGASPALLFILNGVCRGRSANLVSAKTQLLNVFSSASQVVSVAATQPHHPRLKAAVRLAESAMFQ